MANDTIIRSEILVSESCPSCGVLHAFPEIVKEQALRKRGPNGRQIYCPNGHSWHFTGKTDAQKAEERAAAAEARARSIQDQLDAEKRSHAASKGQLTKTKKRIGKGVCPCCNRHFTNVERHMATQHPDEAK